MYNYSLRLLSLSGVKRSILRHMANQNHLSSEKSPYLLQHADNPVDWYPWGREALENAKKENKMLFLSVGYSTCHWCHVMERECFRDPDIAELMNRLFINVKVDREERPDIDQVYMAFVTAISGSGGWPMSVFLTPDLNPVYGGTYFPPQDMPSIQRPGFKTVLKSLHSQWINEPDKVKEAGNNIVRVLKNRVNESSIEGRIPSWSKVLMKGYEALNYGFDPLHGGFFRAPKFPQPVNLNFLLFSYDNGDDTIRKEKSLEMVTKTLDAMCRGGIWDHIYKGFARYSTDSEWHVPHFEKMLYDQAQLLSAYARCYRITKNLRYKETAENIIMYSFEYLRHEPSGGFYSGEDADSKISFDSDEKREGAFCTWTFAELRDIFITREDLFQGLQDYYDVTEDGNASSSSKILEGQNVLRIKPKNEVDPALIKEINEKLHSVRKSLRPPPHLDDKIIASWNGLMISGLCAAASDLENPKFLQEAIKTGNFIKEHLFGHKVENKESINLIRTAYRGEDDTITQLEVPIQGFLEDYSFIIRGFLDLYEQTLDYESWLIIAKRLQDSQDALFWDDENGGFFNSREDDPSLILRLKSSSDGAEPSGNSVSLDNLVRLSGYFPESDFLKKAEKLLRHYFELLSSSPVSLPEMSVALKGFCDSKDLLIPEIKGPKEFLKDFNREIGFPKNSILRATDDEHVVLCVNGACQNLGKANDPEVFDKIKNILCLSASNVCV